MKVKLDDVNTMPQKRLRVSFNEELDIPETAKPVLGELLITSSAGNVHITGSVQTLLKLSCHTCLRPYFQSLHVEIDDWLAPNMPMAVEDSHRERERELTKDDFYEVLPADGVLDITDIVYQAVTLASPVFCRCPEDCPGPPKAENAVANGRSGESQGTAPEEDRIDPRWENLKTLFSNKDSSENS